MDANEAAERLRNELDLLDAMFPGQCHYNEQSQELKFNGLYSSVLKLGLPKEYLLDETTTPEIVSATTSFKGNHDIRGLLQSKVDGPRLITGGETLDAIVGLFNEIVLELKDNEAEDHEPPKSSSDNKTVSDDQPEMCMTVIIWLHHLLATSKRKAALSPPAQSATGKAVSGISKPGYPGVMIFSGPQTLVREHVKELRGMKWQAFQIRLEEVHEESKLLQFEHGQGVTELEAMGDVVKDVVGESNKDTIVKALGIR